MRHILINTMKGRRVLSGVMLGRKLLAMLVETTADFDTPSPLFLDFAGIEVATSSFLREAVIGFRDYARLSLPNVYPVATNLGSDVLEEFEFFLRARSDVFWICELDLHAKVRSARLLGNLDPAQRATFDAVLKLGSATAPQLLARFPKLNIGPTAWNNRLSSLASKGLFIERRIGKTKSFSPLLEID